jgi:hypothetical protein
LTSSTCSSGDTQVSGTTGTWESYNQLGKFKNLKESNPRGVSFHKVIHIFGCGFFYRVYTYIRKEYTMIFFARHPNHYHTELDTRMIHQIEAILNDSVKTPCFKDYSDNVKMFDVLYECDAGVFRPYNGVQFDKATFSHIGVMNALKKPTFIIYEDLSIIRMTFKTS